MPVIGRLITLSLASASLAGSAIAQPAICWDAGAIGAARISEFQIMMMDASLRCNAKGFDIRASYDRFLAAHRTAFGKAEASLKAHFGVLPGDKKRNAYDNYLISLANYYGGGRTDAEVCGQFEIVAGQLGAARDASDLLATVAMAMVRDPKIDGPRCAVAQR